MKSVPRVRTDLASPGIHTLYLFVCVCACVCFPLHLNTPMFALSEVKWREIKWEVGEPRLSTGTQGWAVHFNWGLSKHSAIPLNGPLWWMTGTSVVYFSSQEELLCERQCVLTQKARPAKVPAPLSFIDSWHYTLRESVREKMSYLGTHLQCICSSVCVYLCRCVFALCLHQNLPLYTCADEISHFSSVVVNSAGPTSCSIFTNFLFHCSTDRTFFFFQTYCWESKLSKDSISVRLNLEDV